MHKVIVWLSAISFSLGFLAVSRSAHASGFALLEQSAKGLGEAYSGGTTETEQPNSIFYNPAGIAFMENDAATVGLSFLDLSVRFRDAGSTTASGIPLTGGESGQSGTDGLVPNCFIAYGFSDEIKAGLGLSGPFGLGTKYDSRWVGRYHAIKTKMGVIDVSPAVAWQIADFISIGGAVNVQFLDAELTNAIDFGTILHSAAGTIPQTLDGEADMTGDDLGVGYSLGLLCKVTPTTKIGLGYRSRVKHTVKGKVDFDVPAKARAILDMGGMSNYFVDTHARANITTPASLSAGVSHELGKSWIVTGDISWTGWSCFDELTVKFNSGQPDSTTEEHWTDTMRYALGLNYLANDKLTLRAGTSYDETPIKKNYRTPRIPGNNRIWLALGASYDFNDSLSADVGYLHLFIKDPESNLRGSDNALAGYLIGKYETSTDVFSLELMYRF